MEALIHLIYSGRSDKDVNRVGLLGKEGLRLVTVLVLLFFTFIGYSTNYYVSSSSGNDGNSGTSESSAWRSLEKVNSFTPQSGDQILFKRGDSWSGTLRVNGSGTSGSPIVYGAYGSGEKPKIYGSEKITGWTRHSGNIWKTTVNQEVIQLFIDGEMAQLARYPKTGYFRITTVNSTTEFTSTNIESQPSGYYKGATLMIKGLIYSLNRRLVNESNGQTITIDSAPGGGLGVNKGFFMVDKLEFLTEAGEWCYDSATKTLYAWMPNNDSPDNYTVRGSVYDDGIYIGANKENILIRDLEILHQNKNGIYMYNADRIEIKNNSISKCQQAAIYTDVIGNGLTIDGNNISDCYMRGIYIGYGGSQGRIIKNNIIDNVGRISLIGRTITTSLASPGTAIASMSGNTDILYNRLTNVGYLGVYFNTGVCNVAYNYLSNTVLDFNDGAAIYSFAGNYQESGIAGSVISNNIILNAYGNTDGTPNTYRLAFGIYFDSKIHDVTVENNLIANSSGGINFNGGGRNIFRYNTLFDCLVDINSAGQEEPNTVENNIMYKVDRNGNLPSYSNTNQRFVIQSGNADNNFDFNTYIAPYVETNVFAGYANFAAWQAAGNDIKGSYDGTDMKAGETEQLFYNDTKQNKTFNLGTSVYRDIYGKEVTGKLTLEPFTSKILIKTTKTVQVNQSPEIDDQSFNIAAPVGQNDFIGQVIASDPDTDQTLTYSIIDGNELNFFAISSVTGEIYANTDIQLSEDQTFILTVVVTDNADAPLSANAYITINITGTMDETQQSDNISPTISSFTVPAESNSLTVSISSFSATDNVEVTGYMLTESNSSPSLDDAGWGITPQTEYTFSTEGTKTLYAWAKDASGNISSPVSSSVIITLPDLSSAYSEYLFEETGGVDIMDSEGLNDGIIVNDGLRVDGANGQGLELSGSGYISLGQCFGENVQKEVSMSAWVKPDISSSGYQGIIMHGGPNIDTYALYIYSNTKTIGFKTTGTTPSWYAIDNVDKLWDGNWHHLVAVFNGTEKTVYLDNEVIGVTSAEGTIESGYGYNLLIGAGRDETNPTLLYKGLLDEVRVYNYAVTVNDVGELFHPVNRELNKIYTVEDITICEGEDYMGWTEPGQYERILQRKLESASGADSIVTTNLYVNPGYNITDEAAICEGETYSFGSQTLSEPGEYTEVFETVNGCDSTVILTLTVNESYYISEDITIAEGEDYMGWTESGVYERNLVSSTGCDSTVVTNLSVISALITEEDVIICEGSSYNGWTTSGRYERTLESASGGDSIVVTNLTVNPVYTVTAEAAICEGETYSFGSQILSEPGEYTEVFETINGCDSTVILTLTVNESYYISEDISIAEGEDYMGWTESGVYERNLVSSTGCDSTVVTNLSVISALITEEDVTICEGSSYNGWTTSGRYERTLESASGGDSIVVTNLTVNPVYTVTAEAAICEGETYSFGSQILSEPGEYTEVFKTINGCDSTVILTLTVNENYYITEDITISFGENYNGWTEEGTYQRNLVSVTGCDSTVVTNLSVEQTASQTIYLDAGWNIISSYLIPEDVNIEAVMASLQGSGDLVKVQDESNNTFEYRNKNIGWVNGIGDLQKTEGYKVQVNTNCALEVKGQKVVLPLDVPLSGGWNIISFPFNESVDAMQVVQSLIDAEILIKVQDEAGNSIEYWNDRGWINGIGNFEPGEGYIIHVKSDGIFAIDETYTKSGLILAKNAEATYFQVDYEGNGFDHMNINIIELAGSGLKVGDEIATFDNDICVGAVKLTEQHFELDAVSIPASASEEGQNNGYLDGNSIELKVWSGDTNEEIDISAETIEGEMVYNRQASVFVALSDLSVSVNKPLVNDVVIDVYPNPATKNVNIRFSVMPEIGATIAVFDMSGKQVLISEVQSDIETINIQNLQSGIYFVKIPVYGSYITRKLIKR